MRMLMVFLIMILLVSCSLKKGEVDLNVENKIIEKEQESITDHQN
ncbi:hypothetical protein [Caldalkalibacillus mannanilyticus]|nr:hypothetical protein [Caldalkalibacillus mannanilyticus]